MSALATKESKPATRNYREREHRISKLPVKDMITMRMNELGIKNVDMAKKLGYPMPNVIAMIKQGAMRLPENLALTTADVLQVDRVSFLGKVISENNPRLWDSIVEVLGQRLVTDGEFELIKTFRAMLDGHDDVRLAQEESFIKAVKPVIEKIVAQRIAENTATLERIQREKAKKVA